MAEEKGQDENLPVLMRHKQRCIALLDKFFGETADEEFFQTTPRLYPEHDEVGPASVPSGLELINPLVGLL
jgi:hypothetical protein